MSYIYIFSELTDLWQLCKSVHFFSSFYFFSKCVSKPHTLSLTLSLHLCGFLPLWLPPCAWPQYGFNSNDIYSSFSSSSSSSRHLLRLTTLAIFFKANEIDLENVRALTHTHTLHERKHLIFSMDNKTGESFQKMKHKQPIITGKMYSS